MESLFRFMLDLLGKPENIAVAVLLATNAATMFLFWTERSENRVDRKEALAALTAVKEALDQVKLALVALSGRVPL